MTDDTPILDENSPKLPERLALGFNTILAVVKTLSSSPGVYRMLGERDAVLYVGKAKNLKKRVVSYTVVDKLPHRLQRMVSETVRMEVVTTHTETEALLLESNLIKKLQPRYNILLKDDKSFPYILLTGDHPFPRIFKHRGSKTIKGDYYGPFASVMAVDEAVLTLQKVFQIRNCQDTYFANRTRPCLQYDIKRCTAPCVDKITRDDYAESIRQAKNFLLGKTDQVQQYLAGQMNAASHVMNYEKASGYRDRLRLLTYIQGRQRINISGLREADVIGLVQAGGQTCVQIFFFRHGRNFGTESFFLKHAAEESPEDSLAAFLGQFYQERPPAPLVLLSHRASELELTQAALKEQHDQATEWQIPKRGVKREVVEHALANARDSLERRQIESASMMRIFSEMVEVFDLPALPQRIEIYDNSHIQGRHAYGVMVVANTQGFDKKSYRKFTIKETIDTRDDYGMMREVLRRRLMHHTEDTWQKPDLLLIDGGQGQLTAVVQVMSELNMDIPVVAIAKGPDRNAGKERFFMPGRDPFTLGENSPLLHFLQRLRDEAHRFAIGTHRAKRTKVLGQSKLDEIVGIGAARKKLLLQHFGSAQGVATAGLSDLEVVKGISRSVALKIYQHFHEG
ncbi:excinuclease ABC subunit UvrC [Candidatus Finniella inopinata]|uniref:UvrABC system protein C n=1 Tax=Candidatus Finniella inopinata TaxID=1696036 RepID=A0A4Q7DID5_9PROT|nr:excinuclease ABC subunit UvrC [Candidatus Finniella inopinata]RZI46472.1 excinuclease ABC subunit UvrC [Candidatus Finniella inopinata]